jgi:propionyl-CoA carboxylase alpha chain
MAMDSEDNSARAVLRSVPSGWRNVVSQPQSAAFEELTVSYRLTRDGLSGVEGVRLVSASPTHVVLDVDGVRRGFDVAVDAAHAYVDSPLGPVRLRRIPRFVDPSEQVAHGSLLAPMPGSIVRLAVALGDRVEAGDPILWLEAMKMQHRINAPAAGIVAELPVQEGQQIDVGAVLAVVTEDTEDGQE